MTPRGVPLIEVENLDVVLGETTVLERITFEVAEGKIFGLIGPNGGGKTTLIKTLVGLIRPRAGFVRIDGLPAPGPPASRPGYVPQRPLRVETFGAVPRPLIVTEGRENHALDRLHADTAQHSIPATIRRALIAFTLLERDVVFHFVIQHLSQEADA